MELRWKIPGRHDRISRLKIWLEGREEAIRQNGKNSTTSTNIFARLDLVDSTQVDIQYGKTQLSVPAITMHSLSAQNNKIITNRVGRIRPFANRR